MVSTTHHEKPGYFVGTGATLAAIARDFEARGLLDRARMKSHTLDRSNYSPLLLARVAAGWRRLAEDERHGIVSAAHVAADLAALDAPAAILAMAGRVVQDEIHHLEVCARVLEELDPGEPVCFELRGRWEIQERDWNDGSD